MSISSFYTSVIDKDKTKTRITDTYITKGNDDAIATRTFEKRKEKKKSERENVRVLSNRQLKVFMTKRKCKFQFSSNIILTMVRHFERTTDRIVLFFSFCRRIRMFKQISVALVDNIVPSVDNISI
jgi:hypothetical protein